MSTIKVDTIQTRNGTGSVSLSNHLELTTGGLTINTVGQALGVGTNNPSHAIQVHHTAPEILLEETTTGGSKRISMGVANDGLPFISAEQTSGQIQVNLTGAEVARFNSNGLTFPSAKGVDFSNFVTSDTAGQQQSTPLAKSEILKDYEQGSFTADIKGTSGSIGSGAGLSNTAYYTKIGRSVHIALNFNVTNLGSWGGNINIGGLPFKCMGAMNFPINIGFNAFSGNQPTNKVALVTASQSYIYFADNTTSATPYSALGTGIYTLNGWYITND